MNRREAPSDGAGPDDTPVDRHLIELITDLHPGTALDLGCGSGQNVRWLAAKGWDITGLDISENAIEIARIASIERGLPARFVVADARRWTPDATFDLVISTYALPSGDSRHDVLTTAAAAVARGGTLLVTEFAKDQPDAAWLSAGDLIDLDDVTRHLAGFTIEIGLVTDTPHVHGQHSTIMRVVVVKARRDLDSGG